jgi:positive regulator of sigma E activity
MAMSFLLYLLGIIVLITGVAWIATLLGVSQLYVTGAALLALAAGIVLAIARARTQAA